MFTYRTLKQTIHDALVGAAVAGGAQAVNLLTHDDFTPTSWEHVLVLAVGGIARGGLQGVRRRPQHRHRRRRGKLMMMTTASIPSATDPGETLSDAGGGHGSSFWLEVSNDHEDGRVTVEVWSRNDPPTPVYEGVLTGLRWDGDDGVIELKRVGSDG